MTGEQDLNTQARIGRVVPQWMRSYRREQFPGDFVAGVMVTIIIVPQGLAFALLLGVPPVMGLYASAAPLIIFAVFAKGRFVSPGPTPAAALATLAAVLPFTSPDAPSFVAAVLAVGIAAGVFLMVFAYLGLSGLLRYISQPVLSGFTAGLALLVAINQLPAILGVQVERTSSAPGMIAELATNIAEVNVVTVAIASIAVALLSNRVRLANGVARLFGCSSVVAKSVAQVSPLMVILASAIVVWAGDLSPGWDVKIVGEIPRGVAKWSLPDIPIDLMAKIVVAGFSIALVITIESWSVESRLAEKRRESPSSRNNLFAMGAANIASGLTGGYPVSGGLARSAVNVEAGAVTPLSAALTGIGVLLIVVLAPSGLSAVPTAVLAATIFVAGISQFNVSDFHKAWSWNRAEGVAYLAALISVASIGLVWGLLVGFGVSVGLLILRAACPTILTVEVEPKLDVDACKRRQILTICGDVNFLSVPHILDQIIKIMDRHDRPQKIEIRSSDWGAIDFTAHKNLKSLAQNLEKHGTQLIYETSTPRLIQKLLK
jgi:SulP family sulfate permease